jgi:hypothetical protein
MVDLELDLDLLLFFLGEIPELALLFWPTNAANAPMYVMRKMRRIKVFFMIELM